MTERYHCCYTKTTENSEKNRKEPERRAYGHGSDYPERKRNRDHRPGIFYCGDAWCTCCGALRDLVEGNRKVADTAGSALYDTCGDRDLLSGLRRHQGSVRAAVWETAVIVLLPSDRALHGGGRSSFSGHADDRAFEPRTIPGSGAFQTRLSLDRAGAGGDQLLCEKLHTAVFSYSIALTGKYTIGKGVINFF